MFNDTFPLSKHRRLQSFTFDRDHSLKFKPLKLHHSQANLLRPRLTGSDSVLVKRCVVSSPRSAAKSQTYWSTKSGCSEQLQSPTPAFVVQIRAITGHQGRSRKTRNGDSSSTAPTIPNSNFFTGHAVLVCNCVFLCIGEHLI